MSNQKLQANMNLLTEEQVATLDAQASMAAKVRYMLSLGVSRGDISRYLTAHLGKPVIYQWVRNVELQVLKKK